VASSKSHSFSVGVSEVIRCIFDISATIMASWNGGSGDAGKSPADMRQLSPHKGQVTPEAEEKVIEETEDVVRNFLFERYTEDLSSHSDDSSTEMAPQIQEFMNYTADPLR
jgi:hypothetical protein